MARFGHDYDQNVRHEPKTDITFFDIECGRSGQKSRENSRDSSAYNPDKQDISPLSST